MHTQNGHQRLPYIDVELVQNGFGKVFLLSAGSIPFWVLLYCIVTPKPPAPSQYIATAMVAIFSGIIATTLFLNARNMAKNGSQLAAVDATQSSEVVFALMGEAIFLGAGLPGGAATLGIFITIAGLIGYVYFDHG